MIILDKISKSYEEKVVFKDLSLKIKKGDFVILSGESGSGKTTLLNIIGLNIGFTGNYFLSGSDVSKLSEKEKAIYRAKLFGFIYQDSFLEDNLKAIDNLLISAIISGIPKSEINKNIQYYSKILKISQLLKKKVCKLSGGEKQRISILRALIKRPKILIADEPSSSLDENNRTILKELLCKLNVEGVTIVLATHDTTFWNCGNLYLSLKNNSLLIKHEK